MTSDNAQSGADRKRRGQRADPVAEVNAVDTTQPFETLLRELETLVTSLEDGQLPLEDALALYERGMRLAKACQDRLDTAELRVRRLRVVTPQGEDDDGFALDDFESE